LASAVTPNQSITPLKSFHNSPSQNSFQKIAEERRSTGKIDLSVFKKEYRLIESKSREASPLILDEVKRTPRQELYGSKKFNPGIGSHN
jgi:hypothetical protein